MEGQWHAGLSCAVREGGTYLTLMAVHGWSHAQNDPALRATMHAVYQGLRGRFAVVVTKWQAAGRLTRPRGIRTSRSGASGCGTGRR